MQRKKHTRGKRANKRAKIKRFLENLINFVYKARNKEYTRQNTLKRR